MALMIYIHLLMHTIAIPQLPHHHTTVLAWNNVIVTFVVTSDLLAYTSWFRLIVKPLIGLIYNLRSNLLQGSTSRQIQQRQGLLNYSSARKVRYRAINV